MTVEVLLYTYIKFFKIRPGTYFFRSRLERAYLEGVYCMLRLESRFDEMPIE